MNTRGQPVSPAAGQDAKGSPPADKGFAAIPVLERLTAALGLMLVTGVVGYMSFQALAEKKLPPDIVVTIGDISPTRNGYRVTLTAANQGTQTAAEVMIEGVLERGNETVESRQLTFDFVPPRSIRNGGLFFTQDPRALKLGVRATSYREP